jgi:hypothetical protein
MLKNGDCPVDVARALLILIAEFLAELGLSPFFSILPVLRPFSVD